MKHMNLKIIYNNIINFRLLHHIILKKYFNMSQDSDIVIIPGNDPLVNESLFAWQCPRCSDHISVMATRYNRSKEQAAKLQSELEILTKQNIRLLNSICEIDAGSIKNSLEFHHILKGSKNHKNISRATKNQIDFINNIISLSSISSGVIATIIELCNTSTNRGANDNIPLKTESICEGQCSKIFNMMTTRYHCSTEQVISLRREMHLLKEEKKKILGYLCEVGNDDVDKDGSIHMYGEGHDDSKDFISHATKIHIHLIKNLTLYLSSSSDADEWIEMQCTRTLQIVARSMVPL